MTSESTLRRFLKPLEHYATYVNVPRSGTHMDRVESLVQRFVSEGFGEYEDDTLVALAGVITELHQRRDYRTLLFAHARKSYEVASMRQRSVRMSVDWMYARKRASKRILTLMLVSILERWEMHEKQLSDRRDLESLANS